MRVIPVLFALGMGPRLRILTVAWPVRLAAASQEQTASVQASELVAKGFELLSRNDPVAAELSFRKAIETQPELAAAHRGLGLALWARGNGAAAVRELNVATRLDASDADAFFELAKIAWKLSAQPDSVQGMGANHSASGYLNIAVAAMSKVAALRPQSEEVQLNLAELYIDAGRPKDALTQAQVAVRLAPSNGAAHVTLGQANFSNGEEDAAISEFKVALSLDPASGEAHLGLGQVWLFQRKVTQAQQEFREAIRVSPKSASAYAALAEVLDREGQPVEARQLLEKAIALDPGDWRSQYRLATLLIETSEANRALQLLEDVMRVRPDFLPAREQAGLALLRRGDLKGALDLAEKLVGANPQAIEGHRLMALILRKQRDYEGSLAECAMALASDPGSAQMLTLQALELWQLNRKKDSQLAFTQAAKVEPRVAAAPVFCRMVLCDARDLGPVEDFLRRNRWLVSPAP